MNSCDWLCFCACIVPAVNKLAQILLMLSFGKFKPTKMSWGGGGVQAFVGAHLRVQ